MENFRTSNGMERLAWFSRQLADLLEHGLPLVPALLMVREQASGKNIASLVKELEAGKRFSEALDQVGFPEYFISLIRIAEERGDYAAGLRQCAEFYQSQAKFRRELGQGSLLPHYRDASRHPCALFLFAVGFAAVFGFL